MRWFCSIERAKRRMRTAVSCSIILSTHRGIVYPGHRNVYRPQAPSDLWTIWLRQIYFAETPALRIFRSLRLFRFSYHAKSHNIILDTTRSPRPGEKEGQDYHFVSKDTFMDLLGKGQFLEHAEFSSNCYGTSLAAVKSVESTGRRCILDVELQGVQSIRKLGYPATFILVQPPSLEELEIRLRNRNTETEESLQKRLATARREFDLAKSSGLFDHIIINDVLETAYSKFAEIALA